MKVQIRESRYAEDLKKLLLEERRPRYLEEVTDRKKKEIERMAKVRLGSNQEDVGIGWEKRGKSVGVEEQSSKTA